MIKALRFQLQHHGSELSDIFYYSFVNICKTTGIDK